LLSAEVYLPDPLEGPFPPAWNYIALMAAGAREHGLDDHAAHLEALADQAAGSANSNVGSASVFWAGGREVACGTSTGATVFRPSSLNYTLSSSTSVDILSVPYTTRSTEYRTCTRSSTAHYD
jgi:hypothetical protein